MILFTLSNISIVDQISSYKFICRLKIFFSYRYEKIINIKKIYKVFFFIKFIISSYLLNLKKGALPKYLQELNFLLDDRNTQHHWSGNCCWNWVKFIRKLLPTSHLNTQYWGSGNSCWNWVKLIRKLLELGRHDQETGANITSEPPAYLQTSDWILLLHDSSCCNILKSDTRYAEFCFN